MNQWQQTIEATIESITQQGPLKDLKGNAKTFLISALRQLDVVTREEFDVQAAILSRTRERLEQLEAVVRALEEQRDRAK
jgi:ubiquinone biosynthesis accessory factor UbiK